MASPHVGGHGHSTLWLSWHVHTKMDIMASPLFGCHHGHITQRWTSWPHYTKMDIMASPLFGCHHGHSTICGYSDHFMLQWASWLLHILVVMTILRISCHHGHSTQWWSSLPLHTPVVILSTPHIHGHHGLSTYWWASWSFHAAVNIMAIPHRRLQYF